MFFLLQQITGKFQPYRSKKIELFFCTSLGLHYLWYRAPKIGCTSEIQKKIGIFFCTSLGLHYLCTQKRKRKKYEERNRNY